MRGMALGVLLAAVLAGGGSAMAQKGDYGPGGVTCTYESCMARCVKLSGKACSSYCEATLKERRAKGICKG